jgi:alpha-glucoside transport system permease protein
MRHTTPMIMHQGRWTPWFYLLPALIVLAIFVAYPAVRTTLFSFENADSTGLAGQSCVEGQPCWGILENFHQVLTGNTGVIALRNTAIWLIVLVPGTTLLGLLVAVLTNRVPYETLAKSIIFMPMAISFVGAAIIWRFVYNPNPKIGVLNALLGVFGEQSHAWLAANPPINTLLLTIIGVWIWTGFTMTILAAALKNVPTELIDAARVDGASELKVFLYILLPQIAPTIAVVMTTMTINTLKMFDIVWVMKGIETDVLATRMVSELYLFNNNGLAAAYAVILIVLIIPMMVYNIRRFTIEEAAR